jgi:hypothetical protein
MKFLALPAQSDEGERSSMGLLTFFGHLIGYQRLHRLPNSTCHKVIGVSAEALDKRSRAACLSMGINRSFCRTSVHLLAAGARRRRAMRALLQLLKPASVHRRDAANIATVAGGAGVKTNRFNSRHDISGGRTGGATVNARPFLARRSIERRRRWRQNARCCAAH